MKELLTGNVLDLIRKNKKLVKKIIELESRLEQLESEKLNRG